MTHQQHIEVPGAGVQIPVSLSTIEYALGITASIVLTVLGLRLRISKDGKTIKRDRSEENLNEISERIIKSLIAERDAYREAAHVNANLAATYMARISGLEKDVEYLKIRNSEQAAQIERLFSALRRKDANFFDGTRTET